MNDEYGKVKVNDWPTLSFTISDEDMKLIRDRWLYAMSENVSKHIYSSNEGGINQPVKPKRPRRFI